MPSEVSICNNALAKLGDNFILSLADDLPRARLCNALYADTRDAVLQAHPWNFAIARAQLGQLAEIPAFAYEHYYQLPSDPYCLRVLDMENSYAAWKVEGRKLLTDEDPAKIRYVWRNTDPAEFSPLFVEALSARLAAELAYPITGNQNVADSMFKLYLEKIKEARGADGLEGTTEPFESNDLLDVR